jgi:hypothetical protein
VTDKEVDSPLNQSADMPDEADEAVESVSDAVQPPLKAVKPLPSPGVIALGLQLIFVVVAILGATYLGNNGFRVLSGVQATVIFCAMSLLARLAASASAARMVPGSKQAIDSRMLLAGSTAALFVVFAVFFHDYRLDRFASEGIACLGEGLLHATLAGSLLWLLVRRGVSSDAPAAGMALGTLAGLTGLGMLELHCPILKAMHLMVWHIAVIPVSGLAGYLAGRVVQDMGTKSKLAEATQ